MTSMNKTISFINDHKWLLLLVTFFVCSKLLFSHPTNDMIWDEAVYITIGKYLYSLGNVGLFEEIRPLGLPLVLGLFWKLGINALWAAKIIALIFSVIYLVMIYGIACSLFDKKSGTLTVAILMLTPIFWKMSYFVLTDIPSTVFVLISFYILLKNKLFLAGFFASLAFLFRFPSGLILLVLYLSTGYSSVKKIFSITTGFLLPVIPYFIFNYASYNNVTSNIWHALFRPFILALWHQGNPAEAVSGHPSYTILFYIVENIRQNWLYLFFFVGILFFFFQKKYTKKDIVACFLAIVLPFIYYTSIINKQLRFSLLFLPFVALISAYGILSLDVGIKNILSKKYKKEISAFIIFLFLFFILLHGYNIIKSTLPVHEKKTEFVTNIQNLFENYTFSGTILTSHPAPAVFVDALFAGNYYSSQQIFDDFVNSADVNMIIYSPETYWCNLSDSLCYYENQKILFALLNNFNLIYYGIYDNDALYIFSKNMTIPSYKGIIPSIPVNFEKISLAENPYASDFAVVVRIDDAAAIYREDQHNGIWKFNEFYAIVDYLTKNRIVANWVVIPNDILEMNLENKSFLEKYYNNHRESIEITQHGYDHYDNNAFSEFAGLSYDAQYEKIRKGKKILEETFNTTVISFVPPFNKADDTTAAVLMNLNFSAYSSITSDETNTLGMNRIDETFSIEKDWKSGKPNLYTSEELLSIFKELSLSHSIFVFVIHPHSFETEKDINTFKDFLLYLTQQGTVFMKLSEAAKWQHYRSTVTLLMANQTIFINIDDKYINEADNFSKQLTLLVEEDGVYNFS